VSPCGAWRVRYFGFPDNSGHALNTFDFDKDGVSNLVERALGKDPTVPDTATSPLVLGRADSDGSINPNGDYLTLTYSRIGGGIELASGYEAAGLTYKVEWVDNLLNGTWQTSGVVLDSTTSPNSENIEMATYRIVQPMSLNPRIFVRLNINPELPAQPTDLNSITVGVTTASLVWVDVATDETGYLVEYSVGGGAFSTWSTLPANTTSLDLTGLTPEMD